jgi:hypothetical protein
VIDGDVEGAVAALSEHIRWNVEDVKQSVSLPGSSPEQPKAE